MGLLKIQFIKNCSFSENSQSWLFLVSFSFLFLKVRTMKFFHGLCTKLKHGHFSIIARRLFVCFSSLSPNYDWCPLLILLIDLSATCLLSCSFINGPDCLFVVNSYNICSAC